MTRLRIATFTVSVLVIAACGGGSSVVTDPADSQTSVTVSETSSTSTTQRPTGTITTVGPTTSTSPDQPVTTFVDLVGTYRASDSEGIGFLWVVDDGTVLWSFSESGEQIEFTTMFDGTSVLLTDPDCGGDVVGEYEFRQLDGGDLAVVLLDDPCLGRAGSLPGVYVETD